MLMLQKRLVQVLGGPVTERDPLEKYVYVLTSTSFQKWIIAHGDPDKMFYSCQLEPIAKQAFADNVWVSLSILSTLKGLITPGPKAN